MVLIDYGHNVMVLSIRNKQQSFKNQHNVTEPLLMHTYVGIGWNMNYPFNTGDLICCGQCASNYLDNNAKIPWEDLRYIFGEIMYGGHIVEDWDRRLATAYLSRYFNEGLIETSDHFPSFPSPPSSLSTIQACPIPTS